MKTLQAHLDNTKHNFGAGGPPLAYIGVWQELASGPNPTLSAGTQINDTPLGQDGIPRPYRVLGWTVQAQFYTLSGYWQPSIFHAARPWGRMPRQYAGVTLNQSPYIGSFVGLPQDMTNISLVYDPAKDDLPPQFDSTVSPIGTRPLAVNQMLPVPLQVDSQDTVVNFGFWSMPFVATALSLRLADFRYSILYEDGPG